jgi:hypothetical protein
MWLTKFRSESVLHRLSDYVKRQLDEDLRERGIIVNREVEFRRGTGGNRGERTDILVDAIVPGRQRTDIDTISLVIETKGCWNRDLNHAMQTQLVERYLRESSCAYGLYLVGWFNCEQWDRQDRRKQRSPNISLDEARMQFDVQAQDLSHENLSIKAYVLNASLR